jgi:2-amino-4-hydroxy-6-hydroxymethyldihydropteridine diphosphokinase
MTRVFIGIGSNIDPETNVLEAVKRLGEAARITGVSTFYRTEPEGRPSQPPFYNGVVEIETDLPPDELKQSVLKRIEDELGRVRTEDRYAPRTIDLDVLIYDDLPTSDPRIRERAFLTVPLCELAPDLVLPGLDGRICNIAESFAGHDMEALPEYTEQLRKEVSRGHQEG